MQDLRISLIQTDLQWEAPSNNRDMFSELCKGLYGQTDLVLLPEMFTTGFTMHPHGIAEDADGPTVKWMQETAEKGRFVLVGSLVIQEQSHYYNRLFAAFPGGGLKWYNKRHLFRMAMEHETYNPGFQKVIFHWKGWAIRPLICYDLRFPVWSRNRIGTPMNDYDLLLYIANWPSKRIAHWDRLLPARAIENLAYVAAVNRTGLDGNSFEYNGHSAVLDFAGEYLITPSEGNRIETTTISKSGLQEYRQKFPAFMDADEFYL